MTGTDLSMDNPFTPTFGEVPPFVAGRTRLLNDMKRAFSSAKRHPNLTTAITGARGTGKTALLSLAAEIAQEHGWIAVKTVAIPDMLDDILIASHRATTHLVPSSGGTQITGLEIAQLGKVEWHRADVPTNWRNEMTTLLEALDETGTGLLITVDEVQPKLEEMVKLVAIYQLFVTEGRKVALLMAGLPHNMLQLENDKTVSFLRRSQKHQLGRIADYEVEDAMRRTVEGAGRSIGSEALTAATAASEGFPFMMQLVGFRMWDANPENTAISEEDAVRGIALARAEMTDRIIRPTYDALSAGDKAFLGAMLAEGAACRPPDIARRMGKTPSYATQYKKRLLDQGVIAQNADGTLRFELPRMREYLEAIN